MINVEIAICTWNRAVSLARTLDSVGRAVVPDTCRVNLIVVNNGSTDDTDQVLMDFKAANPSLRVIDEPRQGHSICRNAAIDAADGDFLIWTDDDVLVSSTWLINYVSAFTRDQDASFWGGPILPLLPEDAPAWVTENLETLSGCFAIRDLGSDPFQFSQAVLPYGANFALRTSVQKKFRFDETLGRKGEILDGGDETELLKRLLRKNHIGCWVPDASIEHVVLSSRLTEDWMRGYFEGQGRAMVRSNQTAGRYVWWLRVLEWYHNRRYRKTREHSPSAAWLSHLIRSALASGQVDALS